MVKKYLLLLSIFLIKAIPVAAHHGGSSLAPIRPNPTGISPISIFVFLFIAVLLVYFFYWLFSKDKKKF